MKRLVFFCSILLSLTACANPTAVKQLQTYQCGDMLVHAKYLNDGSLVLSRGFNRLVLNQTPGDCGERYTDITGHIILKRCPREVYIQINNDIFPPCYPLIRQ